MKLKLAEGEPTDYLANNLAVRVCSPKLRAAIEEHRGNLDVLQWLDVRLIEPSLAVLWYSLLHFSSPPDVLDPDRTIWARGNFVVKAVLARAKLTGHSVFGLPGSTLRLIVRDHVKAAIEEARCSGVDFTGVLAA